MDLVDILSWVRPAESKSEAAFVENLIIEIKNLGYKPEVDGYGNAWVRQGCPTLFTCHTDTVHYPATDEIQVQVVEQDGKYLELKHKLNGFVLGADDGAGVHVLLELLRANVKADYVFYRAEEIGGLGSDWSVQNNPTWYEGYQRAIAFDRKGDMDFITHQGGVRCCSDDFARAVCGGLNQYGLNLKPSTGGTFTDTRNLIHLVPECANISVGYDNAHSKYEVLDTEYLSRLIVSLKRMNWDEMPTTRDVSETADGYYWYDEPYDMGMDNWDMDEKVYALTSMDKNQIEDFVYQNPSEAAGVLAYLLGV